MAGNEYTDSLDEIITRTLDGLGEDITSISARTLKQLVRIEEAIQSEADARLRAEMEARRHSLSVRSIAKACGLSHATFHNKKILKRYVNARKQAVAVRSRVATEELLRGRISDLEAENDLLKKHDAQMVHLQIENEGLKRRIQDLEARLRGGLPAMDGKGQVIPLNNRGA